MNPSQRPPATPARRRTGHPLTRLCLAASLASFNLLAPPAAVAQTTAPSADEPSTATSRNRERLREQLQTQNLRELTQTSIVNDSYSRSPLGFATFVAFARDAGFRVRDVRDASAMNFGPNDVVVLLEPVVHRLSRRHIQRAYKDYRDHAQTLILVYPKRIPLESDVLETQVKASTLVDLDDLWYFNDITHWSGPIQRDPTTPVPLPEGIVLDHPQTMRMSAPNYPSDAPLDEDDASWENEGDDASEGSPYFPPSGQDDVTDDVVDDFPKDFTVLVGSEEHALVIRGTTGFDQTVIIVTDPDLLSNYGIVRGENAAVVRQILDQLPEGATLQIDEALHGYAARYSLVKALSSFPAIVIAMQLALLLIAFLWWRLAATKPSATKTVTRGNLAIIRRSAGLLAQLLPNQRSVARLRDSFVRDALSRGGLRNLGEDDAIARLEALRTPTHTLQILDAQLAAKRTIPAGAARRLANRYRTWYLEVTHGT